ncbi:MAG TPA: prefoldin subunit alpha [Nitrososphaerales archaeon]
MSDQEIIQSLIAELRYLESILEETTSRQGFILKIIGEARAGLAASNEVCNSPIKSEVLIPLGGGLFLKAEAPPTDKLFLGIGADVIIEKSKDDVTKFVEERIKEMENTLMGLEAQRKEISKKIVEKRESANEIVSKQQREENSARET